MWDLSQIWSHGHLALWQEGFSTHSVHAAYNSSSTLHSWVHSAHRGQLGKEIWRCFTGKLSMTHPSIANKCSETISVPTVRKENQLSNKCSSHCLTCQGPGSNRQGSSLWSHASNCSWNTMGYSSLGARDLNLCCQLHYAASMTKGPQISLGSPCCPSAICRPKNQDMAEANPPLWVRLKEWALQPVVSRLEYLAPTEKRSHPVQISQTRTISPIYSKQSQARCHVVHWSGALEREHIPFLCLEQVFCSVRPSPPAR